MPDGQDAEEFAGAPEGMLAPQGTEQFGEVGRDAVGWWGARLRSRSPPQLVVLTEGKADISTPAMRLQAPWINRLSDGLSTRDLQTFHHVIDSQHAALEIKKAEA